MSQIVGFLNDSYAVIVSDSNIADETGESIGTSKKLFSGGNFIITSVGVSFGLTIIEGLLAQTKFLGPITKEEIEDYLITYGNKQYDFFLKNYGKNLKQDLIRLYFLFAAVNKEKKLSLGFLGSEGDAPFSVLPSEKVVTAPRRIVLEANLLKLANKPKTEVADFIVSYLRKVSQKDPSVKPPFGVAVFDSKTAISLSSHF